MSVLGIGKSKGEILVVMLVMMAMFAVMTTVAAGLISTQYHAVADQERREQSFHISEAGIHYAWWALQHGVYTPEQLAGYTDEEPLVQSVPDPHDETVSLGDFALAFTVNGEIGSEIVTVTSVGRDYVKRDLCGVVIAAFQNMGTSAGVTNYAVTSWDRQPACNLPSSPAPLPSQLPQSPSPSPSPTPTPSPSPSPLTCPASSDGLVGYWKFDEGSGTTAADSSGAGHHGTLINGPTWTTNTPQTSFSNARALTFDGINDRVQATQVADSADVTFSAWVYPTQVGSSNNGNTVLQTVIDNEDYGIYLSFPESGDGDFYINYTKAAGGGTGTGYIGVIPRNSWTHIIGSFNSSTNDFTYCFNAYCGHATLSEAEARQVSSTVTMKIGAKADGTSAFKGVIDDVRVYNRALSGSEMGDLYCLTPWSPPAPSGTPTPSPSPTPTPSPSFLPSPSPLPSNVPLLNGLVGYWKLDEGNSNGAADSSGNGHTGTLLQGLSSGWTTTVPTTAFSNSYALSFDGQNDYIATSTVPDAEGSLTLSAWIRPEATVSSTGTILATSPSNPFGGSSGYSLYLESTSGGVNRIKGCWLNVSCFAPTNAVANDTWSHVAFVYKVVTNNNPDGMLYLNGTKIGFTQLNGTRTVSVNPAKIGGFSGGNYFKGMIDDVRVYNRALSDSEIASLAAGN